MPGMSSLKKSDAESIRKRRHTTAADPLQPCSMPIIRERRQTISGKAKREARQNYQKAMIAATLSGSLIDIRKAGEKGNPPTTSTLTTETCNMCNRMENNCVNVSNVLSTVLAVSEITRLPSWNIRQVLTTVCSRCLLYIGQLTESSNLLRLRCEKALESQNLTVSPPTPPSPADISSSCEHLEVSIEDPPEESTDCAKSARIEPLLAVSSSTPQMQHNLNRSFHSEPMTLETSDRISDLEDTNPKPLLQQPQCSTDVTVEKEKDNVLKQMTNSHANPTELPDVILQATVSNSRSTSPSTHIIVDKEMSTELDALAQNSECVLQTSVSKSRSASPSDNLTNSMLEVHHVRSVSPLTTESGGARIRGSYQQEPQPKPEELVCQFCKRVYRSKFFHAKHLRSCRIKFTNIQCVGRKFPCNMCMFIAETKADINVHKRIHYKTLMCNICQKELTSQTDYDFHYAACKSQNEVRLEIEDASKRGTLAAVKIPARRKTRLYSRTCRMELEDSVEKAACKDTQSTEHITGELQKSSDYSKSEVSPMKSAETYIPNKNKDVSNEQKETVLTSQTDYDFHYAQCKSQNEVRLEIEDTSKRDTLETVKIPPRRKTQLYSSTCRIDLEDSIEKAAYKDTQSTKDITRELQKPSGNSKSEVSTMKSADTYIPNKNKDVSNDQKETSQIQAPMLIRGGKRKRISELKKAKSAKQKAQKDMDSLPVRISTGIVKQNKSFEEAKSNSDAINTGDIEMSSKNDSQHLHHIHQPEKNKLSKTSDILEEPMLTRSGKRRAISKINEQNARRDTISHPVIISKRNSKQGNRFKDATPNIDDSNARKTTIPSENIVHQIHNLKKDNVSKSKVVRQNKRFKNNNKDQPEAETTTKTWDVENESDNLIDSTVRNEAQCKSVAASKRTFDFESRNVVDLHDKSIDPSKEPLYKENSVNVINESLATTDDAVSTITNYVQRHRELYSSCGTSIISHSKKSQEDSIALVNEPIDLDTRNDDDIVSTITNYPQRHRELYSSCGASITSHRQKGQDDLFTLVNEPIHLDARNDDDIVSTITNYAQRHPELYSSCNTSIVSNHTKKSRCDHSTITNYVQRHPRLYRKLSTNASTRFDRYANNDVDELEDEEDDNGMHEEKELSNRISSTSNWVEFHHKSPMNIQYSNDSETFWKTNREHNLYLLHRLKKEVNEKYINCFESMCSFAAFSLNDIMLHDYLDHYKKPLFYCPKCNHCFTSKVFLDYHLDLQDYGRYVCFKCGGEFRCQRHLDQHLIQHDRLSKSRANTKSRIIKCHSCNFEFLSQLDRSRHCAKEKHDWRKKSSRIKIHMMLRNKVPLKRKRKHSRQISRIDNFILKTTPIPKYKSELPPQLKATWLPHQIGRVEFDNDQPNCVAGDY